MCSISTAVLTLESKWTGSFPWILTALICTQDVVILLPVRKKKLKWNMLDLRWTRGTALSRIFENRITRVFRCTWPETSWNQELTEEWTTYSNFIHQWKVRDESRICMLVSSGQWAPVRARKLKSNWLAIRQSKSSSIRTNVLGRQSSNFFCSVTTFVSHPHLLPPWPSFYSIFLDHKEFPV